MKKLFTLLTMLVLGIGSMWGEDVVTPTSKTYGKRAVYQSEDVLSSLEISTGTYYIKCKSPILVGFTNPFVVDPGSGNEMNLFSESKLTGDYGKWIITNCGSGTSTTKYTIKSVVRNTTYWTDGPQAPLGSNARYYSIIYDNEKGAYRFYGHEDEGAITNKGYVYPIYGSNKFGRDNATATQNTNAAALYELIPADKVTLEDEICLQNVPHTKWTVTAPNQYGGTGDEGGCANIKDESLSTFYHSDWENGHTYDGRTAKKGADGLQAFMIDIGEPLEEIVGFAYRARPNNSSGHAKKVRVYAYETLPTDFPTDLGAMTYQQKENLLKRNENTLLGTPYFDNYNEEWSYSNDNDYKTGMLSQPVKARYILFIQDSGQDAWLTCSDFQIYQNTYITNDKPYLLKIKGKDLYIDTYNGATSDYGKTFVTASTGTPTYFTLNNSQWQISSTKNRQANFVSISNWDAKVKQSTASNWTIQKADDDSYYLSQNTYYGGSDLKKHYLGANSGSISGSGTKLYTDKSISEAVKIQFEPATEYTVSSNLDQGGIIYLGGTYIKGETFGGISGLTQDVFEGVTVSGYVVDELTVEGTSVSVIYTDDDPSIYRIKSGENITLSNIEDFANKSWIIVAENGTLTIDQDYDLTKIDGAGSVVINADVTLSGGKSTVATGKLTINSGKTLSMGSGENTNASVKSFTSVELKGILSFDTQQNELKNVTVPDNQTGVIFSNDMGAEGDNYKLQLNGNTTIGNNAKLITCNRWNFQLEMANLTGSGEWEICGTDDGQYEYEHQSIERSINTINDASGFTGIINLNTTPSNQHPGTNTSKVTIGGSLGACTVKKTSGDYIYYTGHELDGTTLDGVILKGTTRITTRNTVTIRNLAGNNLSNTTNGYALVGTGTGTINFEGNCDFTKKSDNTDCNCAKIGYHNGSSIIIKSGANVKVTKISYDTGDNAAITVEGTLTATKLHGSVTLAEGSVTTLSEATPFNEGAVSVTGDATLNLTGTNVTLSQDITIASGKTLSIGGGESLADISLTGALTGDGALNISTDDLADKLGENESCTLISVTGSYNASSLTINGQENVTVGDYDYYISYNDNAIILSRRYYSRNVTSGNFGSICIPNGALVSQMTGVAKVLEVTEITTDRVVMDEVDEMVAGVPYIFKSNDAAINLTLKGETVAEPNNSTQNYLVGNFEPTGVPNSNSAVDYNYYILQSNQFKKVTSETIKSGKNRCYLKVDKVGLSRQATLGIAVDDGGATGIDAINSLMNNDAEIYDLNGRRLNDLRKGINIVNGVKVIVK